MTGPKCLESNWTDQEKYSKRLVDSYVHFGYSLSDMYTYIFDKKMPENVKRHFLGKLKRPIEHALNKANKQIRATKRLLGKSSASGVAPIASDGNHGLTPVQAMSVLSDAVLNLSDLHIDAITYFAPNLFHDTGEGVARQYWIPVYSPDQEYLAEQLVNPLGRAWFDYTESLQGPSIDRIESDEMDLMH